MKTRKPDPFDDPADESRLHSRTKFCPREVALMWGVGRERILTLIRNGDLPAINVAIKRSGRPRYLISIEDIRRFEQQRAVRPLPRIPRR
jgi:hypothetical protein